MMEGQVGVFLGHWPLPPLKSIRQRRMDGAINSKFQRYYHINTGYCNSDLLLKDPDQDFG